ncbi:MAG: thermonuclease family protein [Candidatus Riflebacteria bacterium]|nr:thermonuclease family protein [Candidatus Riflebacteria bacterium]
MELLRSLGRDTGFWSFVAVLTGLSLFFGVSAELQRQQLGRGGPEQSLKSGILVTVAAILDGDELSVLDEAGKPFVVRILGIKAFESNSFEPGISSFGERAAEALRKKLSKAKVALLFPEFKQDTSKRVLSYVQLGNLDVGQELVAEGLTLAYTRYEFSKEAEYVSLQTQARLSGKGLWGSQKATERAMALISSWEAARSDV